jgi:hypothetical protein
MHGYADDRPCDACAPPDCPTCRANTRRSRDLDVLFRQVAEEREAHRIAAEAHERDAHRIQPPRAWEPAPAVAVTWSSPDGVSYTFADRPDGAA